MTTLESDESSAIFVDGLIVNVINNANLRVPGLINLNSTFQTALANTRIAGTLVNNKTLTVADTGGQISVFANATISGPGSMFFEFVSPVKTQLNVQHTLVNQSIISGSFLANISPNASFVNSGTLTATDAGMSIIPLASSSTSLFISTGVLSVDGAPLNLIANGASSGPAQFQISGSFNALNGATLNFQSGVSVVSCPINLDSTSVAAIQFNLVGKCTNNCPNYGEWQRLRRG